MIVCCGFWCQDAGGADRRLPPALAPLVTYLCPNELELQALTGQPTRTHKQVKPCCVSDRVLQSCELAHELSWASPASVASWVYGRAAIVV